MAGRDAATSKAMFEMLRTNNAIDTSRQADTSPDGDDAKKAVGGFDTTFGEDDGMQQIVIILLIKQLKCSLY